MKIIIVVAFTLFSLFSFGQTILQGVVTYHHNQYIGDRPDLGAKAFIFEKQELNKPNSYDSFTVYWHNQGLWRAALQKHLIDSLEAKKLEGKKKRIDDYKMFFDSAIYYKNLANFYRSKMFGLGDSQGDTLDYRSHLFIQGIISNCTNTRTIDANGNYSFNLKSGKYQILLVSKHLQDYGITYNQGLIIIKEIEVKEGQTVDASHNFIRYEH